MPMSPRLLRPRTGGFHPEASDWRSRVIANGGTVSGSTLTAVSNFCRSIDSAGIRDRFYRLNLFCGSDLSACLVPLYRGQSRTGTQFGNTTDTNNNFVSGDYSLSGSAAGLTGNGTTKYLATGVAQTYAGSNEIHVAMGFVPNTAAGYQCAIGARYNVANSVAVEVRGSHATLRIAAFSGGNALSAYSPSAGRNSFISHAVNPAANSYETWIRGVSFDTRTLGAYNSASTANFLVFAGDTNGTASALFSGSSDFYSIGLRFTSSAQLTAYHNATEAFRTALGRV
jgi:hypothetical protein